MVVNEGYSLIYYPKQNQIVINLPQTMTTLTNTVSTISDRNTDITAEEEAAILTVVRLIMERKK